MLNKLLLGCCIALVALTLVEAKADSLFLGKAINAVKKVGKKVKTKAFGLFEDAGNFAKNIVDKSEDKLAAKYCSYPNYEDPKTRYLQSLAAQVALDIVYHPDAEKFVPTKEAGWNNGWHNDVFVVAGLLRLLVLHNENDKTAVISIAGTRPVAKDWASLAKINYKHWRETALFKNLPGAVHTGMYKKIKNAWDSLRFRSLMEKLIKGDYTIVISGHSQGGGHAGILAGQLHYYAKNHIKHQEPYYLQVLTFGSVRVGDKKFAKYVSENIKYITRVRHKMDAAPAYPPPGAFSHVGKRMLFSCLHTPLHCHKSDRYLKNFRHKMGTTSIVQPGQVKKNCKGTCWNGKKCLIIH